MPGYVVSIAEGASSSATAKPWGQFRALPLVGSEPSFGSMAAKPFRQLGILTVVGIESAATVAITRAWSALVPAVVSSIEGRGAEAATSSKPFHILRTAVVSPQNVVAALIAERSFHVAASMEGMSGFATVPPMCRYYLDARGLYRVFNRAEYRFYRSNAGGPIEGESPFATSESLPAVPADTFGDGTWYLSMSFFSGVLDSGFLPLGPGGETYIRLNASGGVTGNPPAPPLEWRLMPAAGGVVRIIGFYYEDGGDRATQWAIAYTIDGTDPTADDPDITLDLTESGMAVLTYDLPAAADGATVTVRLQTRRNDGTDEEPEWVYSEESTTHAIAVDATPPSGPLVADRWAGPLPIEEG